MDKRKGDRSPRSGRGDFTGSRHRHISCLSFGLSLLTGCGVSTTVPSEASQDTLASTARGDATETGAELGSDAITYTLAEDARVSLVVSNADGAVVCELLHGAPRVAGTHVEAWDGRDERGLPLPAGTYTWKLLAN